MFSTGLKHNSTIWDFKVFRYLEVKQCVSNIDLSKLREVYFIKKNVYYFQYNQIYHLCTYLNNFSALIFLITHLVENAIQPGSYKRQIESGYIVYLNAEVICQNLNRRHTSIFIPFGK